jgi:D-sedoheptulose 7-phosphate isomerase
MRYYLKELTSLTQKIEVVQTDGKNISLDEAILKLVGLILSYHDKGNKIILFGNGGSSTIASHTATDFLKNAEIPALAFSDPSLLTCLSNDLGYENVFNKPTGMFAKEGDVVFAISSSGKSQNILNAAAAAKNKGCFLVTLSGFKKDNPLRELGHMNFYVPSDSYGHVELAHSIICHCLTDYVIETKRKESLKK